MLFLKKYKTSVSVWRAAVVCESGLVKLELERFRAELVQFVTDAESVCEAQPSWSSVCDEQDIINKFASTSDAWALLKRRLVKLITEAKAVSKGRQHTRRRHQQWHRPCRRGGGRQGH